MSQVPILPPPPPPPPILPPAPKPKYESLVSNSTEKLEWKGTVEEAEKAFTTSVEKGFDVVRDRESKKSITGTLTIEDTNGNLKGKVELKDGKLNGEEIFYDATGKIVEKNYWIAGKPSKTPPPRLKETKIHNTANDSAKRIPPPPRPIFNPFAERTKAENKDKSNPASSIKPKILPPDPTRLPQLPSWLTERVKKSEKTNFKEIIHYESGVKHGSLYYASDGLVGFWKLDGNARDISGNNNHGYIEGAIPGTDRNGESNGSLFFDGKDDSVRIDYTRVLNPSFLTYSIWVNHEKVTKDSHEFIVFSRDDYRGEAGYHLRISGPLTDRHFNTYVGNRGGHLTRSKWLQWNGGRLPKIKILPQTWYHLCVSSSLNKLVAYVNGEMAASFNLDHMIVPNSRNHLYIGGYNGPKKGVKESSAFYGKLDNFRIYDRVLSASEVKASYETDLK